jgi:hypothetical protein
VSKSKKLNHLRVVRSDVSPPSPLPQGNASSIVVEVTEGMVVTNRVEARIDDCGELLRHTDGPGGDYSENAGCLICASAGAAIWRESCAMHYRPSPTPADSAT